MNKGDTMRQQRAFDRIAQELIEYFDRHGPFTDYWGARIDQEHVRRYLAQGRSRFLLIADRIRKYCEPGARVLDIGTAYGMTPLLLREEGFDVAGTELDVCMDVYTRSLKERSVTVYGWNIYDEPRNIPLESYDAVIASEVFEHLFLSAGAAVARCSRFLGPGGILMVTTPNLYSLPNLLRLVRGQNINESFPDMPTCREGMVVDNRCHPREPTIRELSAACADQGLQIEECSCFNAMPGRRRKRLAYALLPNIVREHILVIGRKGGR